jgi:hypothetical protein
VDGE